MKAHKPNIQSVISLLLTVMVVAGILFSISTALAQEDMPGDIPGGDTPPVYPSSVDVPTPLTPSGTIYTQKPTYKWSAVSGATKYRYQVYKGSTKLIDKVVTGTSSTPNTNLTYAAHK